MDNVKIGRKGKRVKMARWWDPSGGENGNPRSLAEAYS
jgi:hypothetical protein